MHLEGLSDRLPQFGLRVFNSIFGLRERVTIAGAIFALYFRKGAFLPATFFNRLRSARASVVLVYFWRCAFVLRSGGVIVSHPSVEVALHVLEAITALIMLQPPQLDLLSFTATPLCSHRELPGEPFRCVHPYSTPVSAGCQGFFCLLLIFS